MLAIVYNAAINIRVYLSSLISVLVFFEYIARSGIAGSCVVLFFVFGGTSILLSTVATPIYFITDSVEGSLFSTFLSAIFICDLFDDNHSDRCDVISRGFDMHFSID